ncbi:MinD/ParA family ATP-binding protein [Nocardia pneumoniae]|uniref:MinD/ParA family ATP-binding protein n=1 Tax=Nocardia pneumoniae TaxID=228601 RepID=UPI001FE143ED|nr:MinD/ParA family protein [Nocardia pneumoniae]
MTRNNNDLPMLPPWLSESDVAQSGYEAPVQNLPHDELIEETPSRRRGRFRNRAPEAERPEAARPDKRRKGWRRDKQEPSDEGVQQSAPPSAPGPDGPAPGPLPHDSWQQSAYEQAPPRANGAWGAPHQPADAAPQPLPTRNPSQPSPGFQPLGSRAGETPVPNDWSAPQQAGRPDLPPPPLPDPPRQPNDERPAPPREHPGPSTDGGASERTTGPDRPPLGPQPSQWPSTGNPRLDAALSAVLPNHWPATPPTNQMPTPPNDSRPVAPPTGTAQTGAEPHIGPGNQHPATPPTNQMPTPPNDSRPVAPPTGTAQTGAEPHIGPGNQHPATPPTGPNQAWPTSTHPAAATGDQSAPPQGGRPGIPQTSADNDAWQAGSGTSTSADPMARQDRSEPAPPTGEQHAASAWTIPPVPYTGGAPVGPPADEHSALRTGYGPAPTGENAPAADDRAHPTGDQSATPPVGARPATPTAQAAPSSSASTGGLATTGSDGPPPWLAAPPPEQTAASTTDAPRRLPPLPDPPAPHERPQSGAPGEPETPPPHEERLSAPDRGAPPPWLGPSAPTQAGRPGLPPAPNETEADQAGALTSADSPPSDHAPEPRVRADRRPASNLSPADRTGTEPASSASPSASGPHAVHGGIGSVPTAPETASATASQSSTAPQGTAPHGTVPQSAAPHGPAPQSAAPHGTAPHGTAPQSAAPQGMPPQGTAPQGTASQGTAPQGTASTSEVIGQPKTAANPLSPQRDLGAAASGWTSAAEVGAASARPVGGRHRLPTETSELPVPQTPVEQAPRFDQQPVAQRQTDTTHGQAGNLAPGSHAPADFASEHSGYAPQSGAGQAPVAPQQAPTDHWRDTTHPGTGPAESTGQPAPFTGGQAPVGEPADQWRQVAEQNPAPGSQAAPYSAPPAQHQHPRIQDDGQAAQADGGQWGTPQRYAQPPAQQPNAQQGTPFQQPSLDNVPLRRAKRAPGSGWRKAVHHVSGGAINPGMSAEERRLQELVARIRQPVRGDYRIAVLSLKGGVGKTTTTMGLGSIFASIRGDRVIAVDANPDFGTLSQRVPLQTRSTVRDLLLDPSIQRYSDVRRHTSQGTSRLEVLASERDPAASEAFSDEEYRAVASILQRFYNIILTDCGTGLMHSAMTGVLDLAHSLVLISSAAIDGARSAAATLDWLSLHGHDHLVRNAVVVINLPREGSPNVGIQQLREYFLSRCRAVHIIPYDQHLSEGAEIDLHRLHKQTKRAYVELAATVADDFATDRRRYHP